MMHISTKFPLKNHVPQAHRFFEIADYNLKFIVMNYVPGPCLADAWYRLNALARYNMAYQFAHCVRLMHANVASGKPGPPGYSRCLALSHNPWPPEFCPHIVEYEAYLNGIIWKINRHRPWRTPISYLWGTQLVLTNMQLDLSSAVLDPRRSLHIVGWGKGGYYPPECDLGIAEYLLLNPRDIGIVMMALIDTIQHNAEFRLSAKAIAQFVDGELHEDDPES